MVMKTATTRAGQRRAVTELAAKPRARASERTHAWAVRNAARQRADLLSSSEALRHLKSARRLSVGPSINQSFNQAIDHSHIHAFISLPVSLQHAVHE